VWIDSFTIRIWMFDAGELTSSLNYLVDLTQQHGKA
jgi:hypothetical protein